MTFWVLYVLVAITYSIQRVRKYCHFSLVPEHAIMGRQIIQPLVSKGSKSFGKTPLT